MLKNLLAGWAFAALLLIGAAPAIAQHVPTAKPTPKSATAIVAPPALPLRVATRVLAPFVVKDEKKLSGFSIELWEHIAAELHYDFKYQVKPSVGELLGAVKDKQADLAIAAISITAERELDFDFSQPIYNAGLQIMVRDQANSRHALTAPLVHIFTPAVLQLLGIMMLVLLIPAHLVWWFERRHKEGICAETPYFPGIFKAAWWAAGTLATQADEMPKSPLGRVLAVVWMFVSVVFVAYFTAAVTTSLTVQQLTGDIKSPDDLPGKVVATTTRSTSASYLRENHAKVLEFPQIDEAYAALLQDKADAVVFDSPVLLYYAANDGKGEVQVVGTVFRPEDYGIALPHNSPYREPINRALLTLRENGTYQRLYDKWFTSK